MPQSGSGNALSAARPKEHLLSHSRRGLWDCGHHRWRHRFRYPALAGFGYSAIKKPRTHHCHARNAAPTSATAAALATTPHSLRRECVLAPASATLTALAALRVSLPPLEVSPQLGGGLAANVAILFQRLVDDVLKPR